MPNGSTDASPPPTPKWISGSSTDGQPERAHAAARDAVDERTGERHAHLAWREPKGRAGRSHHDVVADFREVGAAVGEAQAQPACGVRQSHRFAQRDETGGRHGGLTSSNARARARSATTALRTASGVSTGSSKFRRGRLQAVGRRRQQVEPEPIDRDHSCRCCIRDAGAVLACVREVGVGVVGVHVRHDCVAVTGQRIGLHVHVGIDVDPAHAAVATDETHAVECRVATTRNRRTRRSSRRSGARRGTVPATRRLRLVSPRTCDQRADEGHAR